MASVLTHAALPLLAGRALGLPAGVAPRRLWVAATLCACAADLDLAGLAFDVRPEELLGPRGLFHSFAAAAALALLVALAAFRGPAFRPVLALLFLAGASHGLVDAATRGDLGVALFAPFSAARVLLPFRPIPVCPLGVSEWLGPLGATVLLNEALLLVLPLALASQAVRSWRAGRPLVRVAALAGGWAVATAALFFAAPSLFAPTRERVLKPLGPPGSDEDLAWILTEPLPGGRLVTSFDELLRLGLFGRSLAPAQPPWSSGFFPAWYGSIAGRWKDPRLTLIARTLRGGVEPPSPEEAKAWLERNGGEGLSPTEKYDLAVGDLQFTATRHSLKLGHNRSPLPRFWYGVCVGVAGAAISQPEPFRAVDVATPDGHTVRFHPVDIKALLAEAYYHQDRGGTLGGDCEQVAFDAAADCSMNPAGLVIGALNYLGLARRSFVMDVHPTTQSQFYAVASAKVEVTRPPYPPSDEPFAPGFRARVAKLVDVALWFELSSTVLSAREGDVPVPGDPTRYQKVGLRPVPFRWEATLALSEAGELLGGRWRGDPAQGPDDASFFGGGPRLQGNMLEVHPGLRWSFIEALASASADDRPKRAEVRLDD